jgi:dGTP triphosphohydrolase
MFLVTRENLSKTRRVRVVADFVAGLMKRHAAEIAGRRA